MVFLRRHPIVLFVLVTFAWSWGCWIPMALRHETVRAGALPTHFHGLFGPMIGAFVTTAVVDGHRGLRALASSMVRWRVDRLWAVVAVLSPLVFLLVALLAMRIAGRPLPTPRAFERYSGFPEASLPIVYLAALVANGFGEETGWRGFLLPRLSERRSPLAATLMLAPIWALWHAPTFLLTETYRDIARSPGMMLGFLLGITSGAIVLTQIYRRTRGSVLMVALWHASYNMTSTTEAGRGTIGAVVSTLIMLWAAGIVVLDWRARTRLHAVPQDPAGRSSTVP